MKRRRRSAGFTLVEVLVALFAMALLAGLAWQGLDSVLRAREASREAIDHATRLATVVTQWEQDLRAVHDTGVVPALAFDGQTLRLTRRVEGGIGLVAWSVRSGQWQRWASVPMTRAGTLQETWLSLMQMQGSEPGHLTVAREASEWQIYFHRAAEWSNAQSSGDLVASPPASAASGAAVVAREVLPNAVRLVLTLSGRKLTRDVALGPQGS
ncbi:MAG TPA: prepilin-type N-terminal cleavage/methylation domain-containing protein [Rubrivivax sp.]|nr:prepilin-type N-terminal cleavage/methylation domain-containing protein [Rubrivivax sp.]